jgi:hypothetical protein
MGHFVIDAFTGMMLLMLLLIVFDGYFGRPTKRYRSSTTRRFSRLSSACDFWFHTFTSFQKQSGDYDIGASVQE